VVTVEIRQGRCNLQALDIYVSRGERSDIAEAIKAVANVIRLDHNLEHLIECLNAKRFRR
jgi:hypothetical protein